MPFLSPHPRCPLPYGRACVLLAALLGVMFVVTTGAAEAQSRAIGPKDQLQIRVDELPELPTQHEVEEDGTLSLGVIGRVDVQGLTEEQLEERIERRLLESGLRRATVDVRVTAFRSRPVTVLGAVGRPGNHTVPGRSSLLDVLLGAGGLAEDHGGVIRVRRRAENGLVDQVEIDAEALFERGELDANLPIFPGDVINVPEAERIAVLLMGEIGSVGEQVFVGAERATLLTAVAKAGGLSDAASNKIVLQRLEPSGERREIVVDFKRILNGKDPDLELRDGDLIVVKESFF